MKNKTFTEDSKIKIIEAIKWLKTYNDLFKKNLCYYEKIINYLLSINLQSLHLETPILLKDHMKTIEVLNDSGTFSSSGMIINSNVESQCLSDETFKLELCVAIKFKD